MSFASTVGAGDATCTVFTMDAIRTLAVPTCVPDVAVMFTTPSERAKTLPAPFTVAVADPADVHANATPAISLPSWSNALAVSRTESRTAIGSSTKIVSEPGVIDTVCAAGMTTIVALPTETRAGADHRRSITRRDDEAAFGDGGDLRLRRRPHHAGVGYRIAEPTDDARLHLQLICRPEGIGDEHRVERRRYLDT